VQPSSIGPSLEPPAQLPVDAPTVRERTARRATAGAPRSPRHDRIVDRRTALSSLAAELSAAAATIEDPAAAVVLGLPKRLILPEHPVMLDRSIQPEADEPLHAVAVVDADAADAEAPSVLDRLAMFAGEDEEVRPAVPARPATAGRLVLPAVPDDSQVDDETDTVAPEVSLTGHRDQVAAEWQAAVAGETPAAEEATETLRASVMLEVARAETEVLNSRVEAELAARIAAEKRLADAQDELRFLRAEVQMTGHQPRREPGRLGRLLRAVRGGRRPVVPANNPKKERLGI